MTDERPLRRDAERNRRRILAAARAAFAERGLDVTLDEIARRADVGVGTVYRRFPDKEALVDALFEARVGELAALAEAALQAADPWEGLEGFLRASARLHGEDRGLREVLFSSHHGRDRVARLRERLAPLGGEMVARAQAAGTLRADLAATDLPLLHVMLCSVLDYAGDVRPDIGQRALTLVLDGLRAARDGATMTDAGPLSPEELELAMAGGHVPRQRRTA